MKFTLQTIIRVVEVGEAQFLIRLVPLAVTLVMLGAYFNFVVYHGLNDAQSMDTAQLARQIVHGEGYTTKFLRPQALTEMRNHLSVLNLGSGTDGGLFPESQFPPGAPRILPDTYNAPGYPYLLAGWFYLVRPDFNQAVPASLEGYIIPKKTSVSHTYSGDKWIPSLNFIFLPLTGLLIYAMGRRLFDDRVAWLSVVTFFLTDLVWQYSLTALSTSFVTFLVTAVFYCALEIFCVAEACFEHEEYSFGMAWLWAILLILFLAAACLTRLHLLVLLIPLLVLMILMPRPSWGMAALIVATTLALVAPWFWHMMKVSGNPLGSNMSLLLYGQEGYKGDQIFCGSVIPKYESLFKNLSQKELSGFLWHFQHGWQLLGASPMILLFLASLTHTYRRRRAQTFQWFLVSCAVILVLANNFGVADPATVGPWNILVLLFPSMIVVGSAFFFIQLDRLNLQVWLLNNLLVIAMVMLTSVPLAITLISPTNLIFNFPPYLPPLIKVMGQYSKPDEWVTTDMPWASAWYADRASLWLPDSISEFNKLHDNVCPTGIFFLTPVTWNKSLENVLGGEDKDWLAFVTGNALPREIVFPLHTQAAVPIGTTGYRMWSDRPRWQ